MEKQFQRLDEWLSEHAQISRSQAQVWIRSGKVKVNDRVITKNGASISEDSRVEWQEPKAKMRAAPSMKIDMIAETPDLWVINKDSGVVVHPGTGVKTPTLIEQFKEEAHLVHRLDKDTSGLLLVAKNLKTHAELQNEFKNRKVEKHYLALVKGHFESNKGRIESGIGRSRQHRIQMSNRSDGKTALTTFEVLKTFEDCTLLDVQIHTGRTHQIRVHLAGIGHPVAGDPTYGDIDFNEMMRDRHNLNRLFLHSWKIRTKKGAFEAPLKDDLNRVIDKFLK